MTLGLHKYNCLRESNITFFQLTCMQPTMEGSNKVQDSTTAADMRKPVQETGDGATESSTIVGNMNGINSSRLAENGQTFTQICASNAEIVELGMDETSSLYAEPSQEVGYNKPSALVTGVDPEVKVVYDILN